MEISLRTALPGELARINEHYRAIDFLPCGEDDFVVVAEIGGKTAGLGRIVPVEPGVGELGGMYVFDQFRGCGISKAIIRFLLEAPGVDYLYCLPFGNLENLYASFGFRRLDDLAGVPEKILEKYRWCAGFYPQQVLLMGLVKGVCT